MRKFFLRQFNPEAIGRLFKYTQSHVFQGIDTLQHLFEIDCHSSLSIFFDQNASPGTRTQPSINTRALRLMMALVTLHTPLVCVASAPTLSVPDG